MKILYWLLSAVALLFVVLGFAFFASPESGDVSTDALDQWYVQAMIVGSVIGAVCGLGVGALVPRVVHSYLGEPAARVKDRVVRWGLIGAVAGVVLTLLVTLQLAYTRADWPVSPSDRIGLVVGGGRYYAVLAVAWLLASIVFAVMVSVPAWAGRYTFRGSH